MLLPCLWPLGRGPIPGQAFAAPACPTPLRVLPSAHPARELCGTRLLSPPCLPLCLGSPDPAAHSCRPLRVRACPARALPSWHFPAVLHLCLSHLPAPMDGKHRGHGLLGGSPESSPVLGSATSQLCDLRKVINLSDYHLCKMGRQICLPQRYTGELNKNNSKLRAFRSTPGCKYVLTPCSCLGRLG